MRRIYSSLSFRLALTYAGLFLGSLLLLFSGYYIVAIKLPLNIVEARVQAETQALADLYARDGLAPLIRQLEKRENAPDDQKAFHAIIDPHGHTLNTNLPSWPSRPWLGWQRLEADKFVDGNEIDYDALALDHRLPGGYQLIIGRDVENISERERSAKSSAVVVIFVAVVLGLLGGLLMSRAIGRRIDRFTATAHMVMAGDMSRRVPVDQSGDEFDHLARTLNQMLDRIEDSLESVRRVSDSIAHELRTPLARLHANLEDASAGRDQAEHIHNAMAEAERLRRIFDAVLRIARIETGTLQASMAETDLTALLDDVADFYRPEAETKAITLSTFVQSGLRLHCDRDLLFQAIANLLDNAIKYSPETGEIVLSGHRAGDILTIGVRDTGPGVPPEALPRLTERFYRHDKRNQDGLGLGLSFVAAVARLHRSRLAIHNREVGFEVNWTFDPGASARAD